MRSTMLAVALALLVASPAAAQQDLRSPDTRDAAARSILAAPLQDLRSPDTRDAAEGRGMSTVPEVTVVKLTEPAPSPARGFDWSDAGMGAVFVLALGAAGTVAVLFRRRGVRVHPRPAVSA